MAKKIRPRSRVAFCHEKLRNPSKGVDVVQTPSGEAVYKGLLICGLLYECPMCASLITTRRRKELLEATALWKKSGGRLYHLVLTIPHHAGDKLAPLKVSFQEARRRIFNRKPWKRLLRTLGVEYWVTSKEVTWGENGWHLHTHQLLFARGSSPIDCWEVGGQVTNMWRSACVAVGLPRPNRRGVSLQAASGAGAYVSKWGVEDELAKSHLKRGRRGHLTPWDFLRQYAETREPMWGALFTEYAEAMTGSRQLVWSDGLRDWAGLGRERTDAQLANEEDTSCKKLGTIPAGVWLRVVQAQSQSELLQIAAQSGWLAVKAFLRCLMEGLSPPSKKFLKKVMKGPFGTQMRESDWRKWLASDA
jgi:hypothetical protein